MTLTLITGGSSAAIVNESRDVLREALTCGNDAIWILPDRRSARMESSLTSATTPVGIEATTFAALLESLWSLYGDGRRLVERETRDLLLQSALAESSDALGTLSASDALRTAIGRALASGSLREGSSAGGSYKGISQMLDYYRTLLYDSNLIEPMDAIPLLAFPPGADGGVAVVSGFDELSLLQLRFLKVLATRLSVHVFVQYDSAAPATEASKHLVDAVRAMGTGERVLKDSASRFALAPLARALGTAETVVLLEGTAHFIVADTFETEHSAVADAVAHRLENGVAPEEVAVTGWGIGLSSERVAEQLERRGILVEVDLSLPLSRTHFGRAFMAVLQAADRGGRVPASVALASPFLPVSATDVDTLDARWRRSTPKDAQAIIDDLYPRSGRAANLLGDARDAIRRQVGAGWARDLEHVATRMLAVAVEAGRPSHLLRQDGVAHAAVVAAISAAADLGAATDFRVFSRSLQDLTVATGAAVRGEGVLITEVGRLRNRSFDTVVFTGLDAAATDPTVDEGLTARIVRAFGGLGRTNPLVKQLGELYLALLSTRERAIFTRTGLDLGEDPQRPSLVWHELIARTGTDPEGAERAGLELPECAVTSRSSRGILVEEESVRLLDCERSSYSVTELERYASCPYKWFVSRALSPRSIDEDSEALVHGSVAHEALRDLHQRASETPAGRVTLSNIEEVRSWVTDALGRAFITETGEPASTFDEQWKHAIGARIEAMLARDATFAAELKPFRLEWQFDEFALDDFTIHGRVDRIDATDTHLVITDYKSGAPASRAKILGEKRLQPLLYGIVASRTFGKPLAATVFRKIDDERANGIEVKDALTTPMTSPKIAGDAERMQSDLAWARDEAIRAVAGIRAGRIETTPSDAACAYCAAIEYCEVAER